MMQKKTKNKKKVDINNLAISELIEAKNNSKYLIKYLDDASRALLLILKHLKMKIINYNAFLYNDKLLEIIKLFQLR